jgi:hypothetical protein
MDLKINIDRTGFIILSVGEHSVKMKSPGAEHLIGELTKAIKDLKELNDLEKRKGSLMKDYNGVGKVINFDVIK